MKTSKTFFKGFKLQTFEVWKRNIIFDFFLYAFLLFLLFSSSVQKYFAIKWFLIYFWILYSSLMYREMDVNVNLKDGTIYQNKNQFSHPNYFGNFKLLILDAYCERFKRWEITTTLRFQRHAELPKVSNWNFDNNIQQAAGELG